MPRRPVEQDVPEQDAQEQDTQTTQEQQVEELPYIPGKTEELREIARRKEQRALEAAEDAERAARIEEEVRQQGAAEAERSAKLSELRAETTTELDAVLSAVLSDWRNLRGLAGRVDAARGRYETQALQLDERQSEVERFLDAHPANNFMPLLGMFPPVDG